MAKTVGGLYEDWSQRLVIELQQARAAGLLSAFPPPVGQVLSWEYVGPKIGGFAYIETDSGTWRADGQGWIREVLVQGATPAQDQVQASGLRKQMFPERVPPGEILPEETRYNTTDLAPPPPKYTPETPGAAGGKPNTLIRDLLLGLVAAFIASKVL